MTSAEELLRLEPSALAERLVKVAEEARRGAGQGDPLVLADLLAAVRGAANDATGVKLALLEIAEAFLRALARSDLGRAEIALRRFAMAQEDGGVAFLGPLADGRTVSMSDIEPFGLLGRELIDVGVLRELSKELFDLRPSLRLMARDLVDPAPFRIWRRVNNARAHIGLGSLTAEQGTTYLAGELGVTNQQAEQHLRREPLQGVSQQQVIVPPWLTRSQARAEFHIIYRRTDIPEDALPGLLGLRQGDDPRGATVSTAVGLVQDRTWS